MAESKRAFGEPGGASASSLGSVSASSLGGASTNTIAEPSTEERLAAIEAMMKMPQVTARVEKSMEHTLIHLMHRVTKVENQLEASQAREKELTAAVSRLLARIDAMEVSRHFESKRPLIKRPLDGARMAESVEQSRLVLAIDNSMCDQNKSSSDSPIKTKPQLSEAPTSPEEIRLPSGAIFYLVDSS
jgi:hypothetical protein